MKSLNSRVNFDMEMRRNISNKYPNYTAAMNETAAGLWDCCGSVGLLQVCGTAAWDVSMNFTTYSRK